MDSLRTEMTRQTSDDILAKLNYRLSSVYVRDFKKDSAMLLAYRALDYIDKISDPLLKGHIYSHLCWAHIMFSEADKSDPFCELSAAEYLRANDAKRYARMINNIGYNYWQRGEVEKGIRNNLALIQWCDSMNRGNEAAQAMLNVALMYSDIDQDEKSQKIYEDLIPKAIEYKDKRLLALAQNNLSIQYRHQGRLEESSQLLRDALEAAKEIKFKEQINRSYSNLGANYIQLNKLDSAIIYLDYAIELGRKLESPRGTMKEHWHKGEALLALGRYAEAERYTRLSLSDALAIGSQYDYLLAYEQLAEIARIRNRPQEFYQLTDSIIFWKDSLSRLNLNEKLAKAEGQYENYKLTAEITQKESELELQKAKQAQQRLYFIVAVGLLAFLFIVDYFRRKRKKQADQLKLERKYAQANMAEVEFTRKNLAAQLHDDIGQDLVLAQQANQSQNYVEMKRLTDKALEKIRRLSHSEYPYDIEHLGLKMSIEELIDRVETSSNMMISEQIDPSVDSLSHDQAVLVYRVLQECLNNSIKHSRATSAFIALRPVDQGFLFEYKDSGQPFNFTYNLKKKRSLGLKQLIDRLDMLKATNTMLPSSESGNIYRFTFQK